MRTHVCIVLFVKKILTTRATREEERSGEAQDESIVPTTPASSEARETDVWNCLECATQTQRLDADYYIFLGLTIPSGKCYCYGNLTAHFSFPFYFFLSSKQTFNISNTKNSCMFVV